MDFVSELLDANGHEVWWVTPDTSVFDALKLMAQKNIGALLVGKANNKLMGILSERDCARKVLLKGKSPKNTPVKEIMSRNVFYVRPEQSIEQCMRLMANEHVRHLPVIEGKKVIGMISIDDVIGALVAEQEFVIKQREEYIRQWQSESLV
jgi:CBS domain-containing protein